MLLIPTTLIILETNQFLFFHLLARTSPNIFLDTILLALTLCISPFYMSTNLLATISPLAFFFFLRKIYILLTTLFLLFCLFLLMKYPDTFHNPFYETFLYLYICIYPHTYIYIYIYIYIIYIYI